MRRSLTVVVLFAIVAMASPASAQRSALIPAAVQDALVNEISGDISFEHIRWFTHYHRPMGGGEGFEAVAKYVEQKARAYGLEGVRVIRQKSNTPSWSPRLGVPSCVVASSLITAVVGTSGWRSFARSTPCRCPRSPTGSTNGSCGCW